MSIPQPIIVSDDHLDMLNTQVLPEKKQYLRFKNVNTLAQALRECLIFGPGIIPSVLAQAFALQARNHRNSSSLAGFHYTLQEAAFSVQAARPESRSVSSSVESLSALIRLILDKSMQCEDCVRLLESYAEYVRQKAVHADAVISGLISNLLPENSTVMVIGGCGALSSAGCGTAVAGIIAANRAHKNVRVIAPVSHPLVSGARLTAYELEDANVACETLADTAIGSVLMTEKIDAVFIIANRVMQNGDVSAPTGSNAAAMGAKYNGVPYYVIAYDHAADTSCPSAAACPLESFNPSEEIPSPYRNTRFYVNNLIAAEWITGYVTSHGIFRPKTDGSAEDFVKKLEKLHSESFASFLKRFE